MTTTFDNMDRMYRLQRYFYDVTRKYYLLGRDQLLDSMDVQPGERVLEVGCGTARNLIMLARSNPRAEFFGLDASAAMLETASSKVEAAGVTNIALRTSLADSFTYDAGFGLERPFDKIFFSYTISMIPTWKDSIENCLRNLRPGGDLFIVDFFDQGELPMTFRRFLKWWLSKFHVTFWPELMPYLHSLETNSTARATITPLFRRYSFIASVHMLHSRR